MGKEKFRKGKETTVQRKSIGLLAAVVLLLSLVFPTVTVAAVQRSTTDIVPGGLWTPAQVVETTQTNAVFQEALRRHGVDPLVITEADVKEVRMSGFAQTYDSTLAPSQRAWIRDGEVAWVLGSQQVLVKKDCGNPQLAPPPPPPPPAPEGAVVQVRKLGGNSPNGPSHPVGGGYFSFRVEAKEIPWLGTTTGWWELWAVRPLQAYWEFQIPAAVFGGRQEIELTVSEDPLDWQPLTRWQVIKVRPGDSVAVTFKNWKPEPPGPPPGPPPSVTPTPGPEPSPTPPPPPTPTPVPPEKGNNGIGQEKCNNAQNCSPDGQPPGLIDKPGLDNDRTGRTDTNPGDPTDQNQSRGGNKGETPGQSDSQSQTDHGGGNPDLPGQTKQK